MLQPSSSGNALQTCVYIFTALTTIALALRFHAAKLTGRKIYADDALVAVGWVSNVSCASPAFNSHLPLVPSFVRFSGMRQIQ